MESCALGCHTNHRTVFFDIPYTKKQKLCALRASRWKAALKVDESDADANTRVCEEHFFLKEPAAVDDIANPDWVPWLKLNPKYQDDPIQVQQRMQQFYEQRAKFIKVACCIASCPNNKESPHNALNGKLFNFPALETSSYTRRVLSEKRLLAWIEVIQQPGLWDKFDIHTLKICGMHFMNGKMAELTDVQNVDWIPTRGLSRPVGFTDHVAHFDLHSIALLASGHTEPAVPEEVPLDDDDDDDDVEVMDQQPLQEEQPTMVTAKQPPPVQPKSLVNVGFKCILCLGNAALKPLTPVDQMALDELFKDKLCVKSELICKKCCKQMGDFYAFHMSILKIQDDAVSRKIKNIIPVPAGQKPTMKRKAEALFTVCSPDRFQCSICSVVLVGKDLLNKHLYEQHKVKIMCKICKTSFTPEGYSAHRLTCGPPRPAQGKQPVKAQSTKASVTPVGSGHSNQKYSCYICTQFFTPNEMKEHIKTHDDVVKSGGVRSRVHAQVVFDDNYEACKRCSKAIHKNDKEKHQRQHDEERERLKQLIAKQQANVAHRCIPCNMNFPSADQLQKHRVVHKVLACSECNEEFGKKYQLTNHRKLAHGIKSGSWIDSTTEVVECSECNSLINASTLKVHIVLKHNCSPIACEMCDKLVLQIALLKHQESFCNEDNPPVPCPICSNVMPTDVIKEHVEAVHVQGNQQTHKGRRIEPKPSVVNADQVDDLIEEDFVEEERLEDDFKPEEYVASVFKQI